MYTLGCGSGFEFKGKNIEMDFFPLYQAEMVEPDDRTALISINNPEDENKIPYEKWKNKLVLKFHDIDVPADGYIIFDKGHANSIIDFILSLPPEVNKIVVHCFAGISRSGAVVRFLQKLMYPSCYNDDFWMTYKVYNRKIYSVLEEAYACAFDNKKFYRGDK